MLKRNFKFTALLIIWLFAAGHCFAECLHYHTAEANNQTSHHHHQEHQHNSDADITPCEVSVLLPTQIYSKVLPDIIVEDLNKKLINITLIAADTGNFRASFSYSKPPIVSYHRIAINTLLISNAPPVIA